MRIRNKPTVFLPETGALDRDLEKRGTHLILDMQVLEETSLLPRWDVYSVRLHQVCGEEGDHG